ncbi:MAG: SEL1-like repeat protein [Polyangiales bacterium]
MSWGRVCLSFMVALSLLAALTRRAEAQCRPEQLDDRGRCPTQRRVGTQSIGGAVTSIVRPPTNRPGSCRRPIPLRLGAATTVRGDTGRSRHATAGSCVSSSTSPELVYSFRVTEAQAVLFHLESEFDGALYLRANCTDSAEELACNDDDNDARHSYLGRFLLPGTYYLFVDGFAGEAGSFTLTSRVERDCVQGDATACDNMGYIFLRGEGTRVDCQAAVSAFTLSCDGGNPRACNRLGLMYEQGTCLPVSGERARIFYTRGCDGGFNIACSNNGRLHEDGRGGVEANVAAARGWYARGCQGDDFSACGSAATLSRLARQYAESLEFARRGCDGRDGTSCNQLGLLYEDGLGVVRNPNRAAQYYEQACDLGMQTACSNLGQMVLVGEGTSRDPERARGLFERACTEERDGPRAGCLHLGRMYRDGVTVAEDRPRARRLMTLGCEREFYAACNELGVMCGNDNPQDFDCARANYERACEGGYLESCSNLGILHDAGLGTARDPARAVALYRRACGGDVPVACNRLAEHLAAGGGVARDADRAVALYRTTCDGGHQPALPQPRARPRRGATRGPRRGARAALLPGRVRRLGRRRVSRPRRVLSRRPRRRGPRPHPRRDPPRALVHPQRPARLRGAPRAAGAR